MLGLLAFRRVAAVLLAALAVTACSPAGPQPSPSHTSPARAAAAQLGPDPETAVALIRIAQTFNDDYDNNNDGPVWDRWDARSQAVISRAEYIRRHAECVTAPQAPARVEKAVPGPHGAWLVDYEIGGQQLTDYWFYISRRWVFDLVLSNPEAARQYRLPFAQYAAAMGCQGH